jgi:hypothetical protein
MPLWGLPPAGAFVVWIHVLESAGDKATGAMRIAWRYARLIEPPGDLARVETQ